MLCHTGVLLPQCTRPAGKLCSVLIFEEGGAGLPPTLSEKSGPYPPYFSGGFPPAFQKYGGGVGLHGVGRMG